jgi:hypothetical protein
VKGNIGYYKFVAKWRITSSTLSQYIQRGEIYRGVLPEPKITWSTKMKNFTKGLIGLFIKG